MGGGGFGVGFDRMAGVCVGMVGKGRTVGMWCMYIQCHHKQIGDKPTYLRVDGEDDEGVVVPAADGLDARGQRAVAELHGPLRQASWETYTTTMVTMV
jgi:hypothetical protein